MALILLLSAIMFFMFVLSTYLYADLLGSVICKAVKFLLEEKDDEK